MHCTAFTMGEVMNWVDAFSITTGLTPSVSLSVYAELCRFHSTYDLIKEIADRESMFLRCDEMGNPDLLKEYANTYIAHQDEQLEVLDPEAMAERIRHYDDVLDHHGFKRSFIESFFQSLSPTGDCSPEPFEVKSRRALVRGFDKSPFYPPRQMKTPVPNPFEELQSLFRDIQRETPMNPQGWIAVMKALGLSVVKGSVSNAWTFGEPSFHLEDDADPIPVFIVGVLSPPYIPNPTLAEAEALVGEYLSSRQNRRGILFTGVPVRVGDDPGNDFVVYWGKVYSDEVWHPLILHSESHSINQIVKDGIAVHDGLEGVDLKPLMDVGGRLVKVFADHHLDPTAELFTREATSQSIH